MATATYTPISTTTLSSSASSITFSSIPNTYTDLRLIIANATTTTANHIFNIQFNSDTGNNYSFRSVMGTATSGTASSSNQNINTIPFQGVYAETSTTIPELMSADIFSYVSSIYKTVLFNYASDQNGSGEIVLGVGLWRNTSAITSIKILLDSGNINTGTTATIYGILKA